MNAYQTVPTMAQRRELDHFVQRHYPVRQYRDNQPSMVQPEPAGPPKPCQFCAVEVEAESVPLFAFLAISIGSLGLWAAIGYATWWLVGAFLGVKA
jgi:hypothetical protein